MMNRLALMGLEVDSGTYGEPVANIAATQMFRSSTGRTYFVRWGMENLSNPMGGFEILDIARVRDEFGMSCIEFAWIGQDEHAEVAREFTTFMVDIVRRLN